MQKRILLLTIMLVASLLGCGTKMQNGATSNDLEEYTWQQQYDLGMRYLAEGKYAEAVIAFSAAIQIDAKQAQAFVGRGDAFVHLGTSDLADKAIENFDNALTDYQHAASLGQEVEDEKLSMIHEGKGDAYLLMAKQLLDQISPSVINDDGKENAFSEELTYLYKQAEESYLQAIALDSQKVALYIKLSDIYDSVGDLESYRQIIERGFEETGAKELEELLNGLTNTNEDAERATAVETLQISDFSYTYDSGGGMPEVNTGAVGGMKLSFNVDGPSNVCEVRIWMRKEGAFSQAEISEGLAHAIAAWKPSWNPEYGNRTVPFYVNGTSFPVFENNLGKTEQVMLIGIDRECNAVGYTLVSVNIPNG